VAKELNVSNARICSAKSKITCPGGQQEEYGKPHRSKTVPTTLKARRIVFVRQKKHKQKLKNWNGALGRRLEGPPRTLLVKAPEKTGANVWIRGREQKGWRQMRGVDVGTGSPRQKKEEGHMSRGKRVSALESPETCPMRNSSIRQWEENKKSVQS